MDEKAEYRLLKDVAEIKAKMTALEELLRQILEEVRSLARDR